MNIGIKKFPFQQIEVDEEEIIANIGLNIHRARVKKNISVRMLALQAGIDERHLYRIESGEGQAGIMTIIRVAKALDMDINDLVEGEFKNENRDAN